MNPLAQELLAVAKTYLGPAAQAFLANEFRAMGISANTVTTAHVETLVANVRVKAARAMGEDRAVELAGQLAALGTGPARRPGGDHRLASDAAEKLFATGRLRQAEAAYRELAAKHGDAESYRGLARAQAALEDEAAAFATLREGAVAFAAKGDRMSAVALLAEAVALSPRDLAAHRRLAAALANQGDLESAIDEYRRFVDEALAHGDTRRAWLELAYGRETLGDLPGLLAIVDRVAKATGGAAGPSVPRPSSADLVPPPRVVAPDPAKPLTKPTPLPSAMPPEPAWPTPTPATRRAATPPPRPVPQPPAPAPSASHGIAHPLGDRLQTPAQDGRTRPDASHTAVVLKGAKTLTHAEHADMTGPQDLLARAGLSPNGHAVKTRPERPPVDAESELKALVLSGSDFEAAQTAASRAALLVSMNDVRATEATIDAARRLLALGLLQSASDVLLDYIGHGYGDREAQRLLIDVDCALGRRDVARQKCQLLSYAYRLDGRAEVADDVDRLARIL